MRRYVPLLLAIVLGGCSIGGGDSTTAGSASLATSGPAPTSTQRQAAEKLGVPPRARRPASSASPPSRRATRSASAAATRWRTWKVLRQLASLRPPQACGH